MSTAAVAPLFVPAASAQLEVSSAPSSPAGSAPSSPRSPSGAPRRLTMEGMLLNAAVLLRNASDPKLLHDGGIPLALIAASKGIALITNIKAGFLFTGVVGTGVVVARLADGSWSGPSAIGAAGVGVGFQVGASRTDEVVILNEARTVEAMASKGAVSFGADVQVSLGPVGRELNANLHAGNEGAAGTYSYSCSEGLFAGLSIDGEVYAVRNDENAAFYGRAVTPSEILSGAVRPPPSPEYDDLVALLNELDRQAAALERRAAAHAAKKRVNA